MTNEVELYNVIEDPFERDNQATARPELVAEMTGTLENWWAVYE